ncbi:hypothetical protein QZH41_016865 [Actinostola sp. cb2023]|nr:hypothetical protein QZH41_016865 [Actinostola sp. cb2023]
MLTPCSPLPSTCPIFSSSTNLNVFYAHHLNVSFTINPTSRTSTFGDRTFSMAAPSLWNNLPDNLKHAASVAAFKSSLKTFLFTRNI